MIVFCENKSKLPPKFLSFCSKTDWTSWSFCRETEKNKFNVNDHVKRRKGIDLFVKISQDLDLSRTFHGQVWCGMGTVRCWSLHGSGPIVADVSAHLAARVCVFLFQNHARSFDKNVKNWKNFCSHRPRIEIPPELSRIAFCIPNAIRLLNSGRMPIRLQCECALWFPRVHFDSKAWIRAWVYCCLFGGKSWRWASQDPVSDFQAFSPSLKSWIRALPPGSCTELWRQEVSAAS